VPLENLVLRLLAKDPKDRPVDAHRVHADLLEMARAADVFIPSVPESEAEVERSIRALPPSVTRPAIERWARREQVFQEMLSHAYGSAPPYAMASLLDQIRARIPRIAAFRTKSMEEQSALAAIEEKGREGRQRLGFAVDALGLDASRAKDEVRVVEAHLMTVRERAEHAVSDFRAAHVEILRWEGRSAFQEPYPDLAQAYRQAATAVDAWSTDREAERRANLLRESNDRKVSDLEYQIQALRAALATHEREVETERDVRERQMLEFGKQADVLEAELVGLVACFCEPLRARPELSLLFEQLEGDVAA
jgi:serine/threonine-protein kinase